MAQIQTAQIDAENSLKNFSRYVDRSRPLSELREEHAYEFYYLRESRGPIERIVFSSESVRWLNDHEVEARMILDAVNMGWARNLHQNGIKILTKRSPHIEGRIFEINNSSGFRPLMSIADGLWQVHKIVRHDDVDLAVQSLKPL